MASQTAVAEILDIASRYPKAKWLVVSADPEVSAALARSGAKMASKPTEASGIVLVDTLHQLSSEELTTLAAFLHEGRPFLVSVPNRTHGSLRLAALASQPGNDAAMHLDAVVSTLQSCGLDISEIAAVGADVLDSETGLDVTGLPAPVFDWLRNQLGATEQRFVVLGIRTDSADRAPVPAVRPLGSYVRPSSEDDARTLVSERERQAIERAEGAEERVRELEADAERLNGQIRSLHEAAEAQRKEFVGQVERIRAELQERARKAIEQGVQESNFTRKAELKAAAKTEKKLRAELEQARARIEELVAARGAEEPAEACEVVTDEVRDEASATPTPAEETAALAEPQLEDAAVAEVEPELEAEIEQEPDAQDVVEDAAEAADPETEQEPAAGSEPQPELQAEAEPEPVAEPVEEEAEPEVEAEAGPVAEPAVEEPAAVSKPEPEAEPVADESLAQSAVEEVAEPEAEQEPLADTVTEAVTEPEAKPQGEQAPAAEGQSQPEPVVEPDSASVVEPQPEPAAKPQPQPEPEAPRRSRFGRFFGRR